MSEHLIKVSSQGGIWLTGTIDDNAFGVKVCDEESHFGIDDGRVIKLYINDSAGQEIVAYERGWEKYPQDPAKESLLDAILGFVGTLPQQDVWRITFKRQHSYLVTEDCVLEFEKET